MTVKIFTCFREIKDSITFVILSLDHLNRISNTDATLARCVNNKHLVLKYSVIHHIVKIRVMICASEDSFSSFWHDINFGILKSEIETAFFKIPRMSNDPAKLHESE